MIINGKNYRIPELGFGMVRRLEGYGISLFDIQNNPAKKFYSIITAFACITLNIEPEQADFLLEQHLLGGGNFEGYLDEITEAVGNSGFFQAMLRKNEKKSSTQKKAQTE
jgi:hypothetical protein